MRMILFHSVISANAVQLANQGDDIQGLQTLNNVSSVESVSVNYSDQDTPFFVPGKENNASDPKKQNFNVTKKLVS